MSDNGRRRRWSRLAVLAVIAVVVIVVLTAGDLEQSLRTLLESRDRLGPWAPVVMALACIPACLIFIPNTVVSPAMGFLFGPVLGSITAIIGLTLGNTANFLASRYVGRGWYKSQAVGRLQFRAIDLMCRDAGFKIVLLMRLTPAVPSNLVSYLFGLTCVDWRLYMLGTAAGMAPRIIVYAMLGAAAQDLTSASATDSAESRELEWTLYAGIVATIIALIVISRMARRALQEALKDSSPHAEQATASDAPVAAPDSFSEKRSEPER